MVPDEMSTLPVNRSAFDRSKIRPLTFGNDGLEFIRQRIDCESLKDVDRLFPMTVGPSSSSASSSAGKSGATQGGCC